MPIQRSADQSVMEICVNLCLGKLHFVRTARVRARAVFSASGTASASIADWMLTITRRGLWTRTKLSEVTLFALVAFTGGAVARISTVSAFTRFRWRREPHDSS